jgi:hypothetical protein
MAGYRPGGPAREIYYPPEEEDERYYRQVVHPQQGHIAQGFDYGAFPDTHYEDYEHEQMVYPDEEEIDPQGKVGCGYCFATSPVAETSAYCRRQLQNRSQYIGTACILFLAAQVHKRFNLSLACARLAVLNPLWVGGS